MSAQATRSLALFAALLLGVSACTKSDFLACTDHAQCAAAVNNGEIQSGFNFCHPNAKVCYGGCITDEECQGGIFNPGATCQFYKDNAGVVDDKTRHCLFVGTDGGVDAPAADAGADADISVDAMLLANGEDCDDSAECESQHCIGPVGNKFCCSAACDGVCEDCDQVGSRGTCLALSQGTPPKAPGCGSGMCAGQCDGNVGQCSYPMANMPCGGMCTGDVLDNGLCSTTSDDCTLQGPSSCAPFTCDNSQILKVCKTGCDADSDCALDHYCSRVNAHTSGTGTCVMVPASNVFSSGGAALNSAINALSNGATATYVLDGGGIYNPVSVSNGKNVTVLGRGDAQLLSTTGNAVTVSGGSEVLLEGLTLNAGDNSGNHGIECDDSGSKVTVIEGTITGAGGAGIDSNDCDVTVRRSTVSGNDGGGIDLDTGTLVVTNSSFLGNGSGGSNVGAIKADTTSSGNTLDYVTITDSVGTAAALNCVLGTSLNVRNSIIYGNFTANPSIVCNIDFSDLENGTGTNVDVNPMFNAVDLITPETTNNTVRNGGTAITGLTLDINNQPRDQGGPSMGAVEVP